MIPNKDKVKIKSENLFPVVGIGASAGGLEAFKRLLVAIPEDSGMAYILVQHLDPSHDSILAEILQKITKIPVLEITDNIEVEENKIYVIPANKLLTATDGVLQLSPRLPKTQNNMPIDVLFTSLAEVHQSHAIGVVLSGTGSDGTMGLKAIKDYGGITIAQVQDSAAYKGMPQSAIDAEVVDFTLTPEDIPQHLIAVNHTLRVNLVEKLANGQLLDEDEYNQILNLLRVRRSVDFSYYKQATIRRRITRRIALNMKESMTDYLPYLKENPLEQDMLFQDLLIPVTEFFRDPKVFEIIQDTLFPVLVKDKHWNEPLRIWIAGCSTGEEAYSYVIALHEFLEDRASPSTIQVFATDISEAAIAKARSGIYKKSEVSGLSAERLQKFFTKTDGKFRLNKSIRDSCVFAYHNFLKDPPFAKIDLISCRNSLIYVEPVLQKTALTTFHYALRERGFLVLGKSETTSQAADLYTLFDKKAKIFTRRSVKANFLNVVTGRKDETYGGNGYNLLSKESSKDDFQKNADELILSKYAPPGVIVNNDFDIVQFRGATGNWLEQPSGKPNMNVIKMAKEGLAFELRSALHKARRSNEPYVKKDILMSTNCERLVTIEVIPLLKSSEPHFLILFKDSFSRNDTNKEPEVDGTGIVVSESVHTRDQIVIEKLKRELEQGREDMRSITEEQEISNEELQSANEELLSGNEELQSLNEELETSKEEIQTTNEELIIVNQELVDRNDQLNIARMYAESIVTTIREPLIILNKNLFVRTANKSYYKKFHTSQEETEGRLLFEIGDNQWDIPGLRNMLEKALIDKINIVDFEVTQDFPLLGEKVMCLNVSFIARDINHEQCLLLAIEDVTEKRKADAAVKLFEQELEKQVLERTHSLHEANMELQHSNKQLQQFAYIASHDLQEPLRKMRTFSSLLLDKCSDGLPEITKQLILKIASTSERMSTLIKEVLNFSKILHETTVFEKTDLNDIVKNVKEDFELLINEKKAVINCEPLPVIEAIPLQINQLFYNLISNSLKFAKKEIPPIIEITSKTLTAEDAAKHPTLNPTVDYCEISVKDNGIGFDQQYAEQIFLIFQHLHTREHYQGTGIGLALSKTIVINHHGEILATSSEGNGALFQIILPLRQS